MTDPSSQLTVGMASSPSYEMSLMIGTFLGSSRQEALSTHWVISQEKEAELQRS